MKIILTILIGLTLTNYSHAAKTTISNTVIASTSTASTLVSGDTLLITGTLVLNSNYTVHASNNIIVQIDGGSIVWNGNYSLDLGSNSFLNLYNGGALTNGIGSCNSQKRIRFGLIDVVSCNGGGGSGTFSFANYNTAGGGGVFGPLPVELISFDVKRLQNTAIQITWITANELNNARFEVERSFDGVHFDIINTVAGTNTNQTQVYAVIDANTSAKLTYYRLKQVDNNLEFTYSNTVQLTPLSSSVNPVISLQPNPNQGVFSIQWSAADVVEMNINIYDLKGSLVLAKKVQSNEGDNTLWMNLESLPIGTYMVTTQINDKTSQAKFQKLKD